MWSSSTMRSRGRGDGLCVLPAAAEQAPRGVQDPDDAFSAAQLELRRALALVIPFRANNFMTRHEDHRPAGELSAAMRFADECASQLMGEIQVEGIGAGLTIQIQGRVKSLYSTHRKMQLKGVPIGQVRLPETSGRRNGVVGFGCVCG